MKKNYLILILASSIAFIGACGFCSDHNKENIPPAYCFKTKELKILDFDFFNRNFFDNCTPMGVEVWDSVNPEESDYNHDRHEDDESVDETASDF